MEGLSGKRRMPLEIDYVIIKASEGESFKDWRFKGRWRKADKYSYKRGAYHFFRPGKDGVCGSSLTGL